MIAITSANVKEKVLGLGSNLVSMGQMPPQIATANPAPYNLPNNSTLQVRTWPQGVDAAPVDTTILFSDILFPDMTQISDTDLINAINAQVLYSTATFAGGGLVAIRAGGVAAPANNNGIQIVGGSQEVLDQLGLTPCTVDQSVDHTTGNGSPFKRIATAGDMTINLDVVSDDLNTRTALADLVYDFFTIYMADRMYQLQGRSYLDSTIDPPEWFQLVLERKFTWAGEYATMRQGGEQESMVYSIRGSVPMIAIDYINRYLNRGPNTFLGSDNLKQQDDLPSGDYPGDAYL
jgi:hypothetical protein